MKPHFIDIDNEGRKAKSKLFSKEIIKISKLS